MKSEKCSNEKPHLSQVVHHKYHPKTFLFLPYMGAQRCMLIPKFYYFMYPYKVKKAMFLIFMVAFVVGHYRLTYRNGEEAVSC